MLHGSVAHVDVHGEFMLWVTTDSAWQMWSVLYAEAVECMSSVESVYGMLECQLCCELLVLLNMHGT